MSRCAPFEDALLATGAAVERFYDRRGPVTPAALPSILLAIETTGSGCSAVVLHDGAVLAAERRELRHGHAEVLVPLIDRVMAEAGVVPARLEAVAVAVGPGSFTGIRVGLAAAHGIALATGARLVGVSTFAAVAAAITDDGAARSRQALLVALDSRREDFYVQLFAADGSAALAEPAAVLPDRLYEHVAEAAGGFSLLIAGDAAAAAATFLDGRVAVSVAPDTAAGALGVAAAAMRQLRSGKELALARPLYLRPPDVTPPKARRPLPAPAA